MLIFEKASVYPLHRWDFMLELYNRNIFIDVDGSHHDLKQLKYYARNPRTKRMDNMEQNNIFMTLIDYIKLIN